MKPISVVIPTANHPAFLKTALQSVSRQTALDAVEEIVVSENSGTREAEKLCTSFSHLPIRYIHQASALSIVEHFLFVFRQARAPLVAFLCDDDWWAPGHLQRALLDLKCRAEATGWFSACMYLGSDGTETGFLGAEGAQYGSIARAAALWLVAGKPDVTTLWYLRPQDIVATSAILSPFHPSTMVIRRDALISVAHALENVHPRQLDQRLYVAIARHGSVLFDPAVDTFIRWSGTNYSKTMSVRDREEQHRKCTETIWQHASNDGLNLSSTWQQHLARAPRPVLQAIGECFRAAMDNRQLAQRGFSQFLPPPWPVAAARKGARFYRRVVRYLTHEILTLRP